MIRQFGMVETRSLPVTPKPPKPPTKIPLREPGSGGIVRLA
jgi:hypothetical protein